MTFHISRRPDQPPIIKRVKDKTKAETDETSSLGITGTSQSSKNSTKDIRLHNSYKPRDTSHDRMPKAKRKQLKIRNYFVKDKRFVEVVNNRLDQSRVPGITSQFGADSSSHKETQNPLKSFPQYLHHEI